MKRLANLLSTSSLAKIKGSLSNPLQSVINVAQNQAHMIPHNKKPRLLGWVIALGFLTAAGYNHFNNDVLTDHGYTSNPKIATVAARYYEPYAASTGTDINYSSTQFTSLQNHGTLSDHKTVGQIKTGDTPSKGPLARPASLQDVASTEDSHQITQLRSFFNRSLAQLPQSITIQNQRYHLGSTQHAQATVDTLEKTIRTLGLNPEQVIRQAAAEGQGGIDELVDAETANLFKKQHDADEKTKLTLEKKELLEKAIQSFPLVAPVEKFRFTSGFGARRDPFHRRVRQHNGVDLAAPTGTPILAPSQGKVIAVGRMGGYGQVVKIDHGFGIETVYAHLSKALVKEGDEVKPQQIIALMGSTGRSTGSHLHYEIRVNGRAWNPQAFIDAGNDLLALKKEQLLPLTKKVHNF